MHGATRLGDWGEALLHEVGEKCLDVGWFDLAQWDFVQEVVERTEVSPVAFCCVDGEALFSKEIGDERAYQ